MAGARDERGEPWMAAIDTLWQPSTTVCRPMTARALQVLGVDASPGRSRRPRRRGAMSAPEDAAVEGDPLWGYDHSQIILEISC
jgi:hypothetical protein